jgi:hypothetical protein
MQSIFSKLIESEINVEPTEKKLVRRSQFFDVIGVVSSHIMEANVDKQGEKRLREMKDKRLFFGHAYFALLRYYLWFK